MKKKLSMVLAGIAVCTLFTACSKATNETEVDTNTVSEAGAATDAAGSESSGTDSGVSDITIDFDNLTTKNLVDVKASDYVTLGEYNGVTVEATLQEITDADVDDYLNNLFASNPPMTEVTDRAVEDGDTVNIDYVGKYADTLEAFDGGTAQGATLVIGSNSYIDGFESGLIGVNKGETVDLDLTFPENYGTTELAGKAVVFTVTVNSISVSGTEMTDEWAAGLGIDGVTTIDELKAYARGKLSEQALDEYNATVENNAIQTVFENTTFADVPEELVNRYLIQQNQLVEYYATMYSYMYGSSVTPADVVNVYMQNEGFVGTADDYLYSIARDMTNQYLMFQTIADEQGLTVSEEEIDEYLKTAYESASSTAFSSFEEYKASLDLETYREGLMAEKVVGFIVDNANVVGSSATAAE